MNKVKRFISTSAIYFVGNILSKLVAFFLLPLYTRYISPEQYGEYDLVLTFINLIAPIAFFQIWDGMFRFAFDKIKEDEKYKTINNAIAVFASGVLLYIVLYYCTYRYYHFDYFLPSITYGFLFAIQYLASYAARLFLKNTLFVLSGVVNTFVTAVTNVLLIVVFDCDVESLYVAASLGCVVQILIIESNLKLIKHFQIGDIRRKSCLKMLRFSVPLCLATISYWLLSGFTKISVTNNLGVSENGQYAVANRFASMITVFVNVFQFAWNEIAYIMANDDSRKDKFGESISLLFKTVVIGSAVVCIVIKTIFPYFIGEQYSYSFYIIPISIIGVAFNAIAGFLGTFFMMEKKTYHILYTTIFVAALNSLFCYTFINSCGLIGAVIVLTAAFIILMILRLIILEIKFDVKFSKSTFIYGVVYVLTLLEYYLMNELWVDILCIPILLGTYLFSVRKYVSLLLK